MKNYYTGRQVKILGIGGCYTIYEDAAREINLLYGTSYIFNPAKYPSKDDVYTIVGITKDCLGGITHERIIGITDGIQMWLFSKESLKLCKVSINESINIL